jgi:periplasmic divalent cation tolerance protein
MISVYITCGSSAEAEKIAEVLLEKRLIACANMIPANSMFWWRGKIKKEGETIIFAKTKKENFEKVKEVAKELHSYDVPCIVAFNISDKDEQYFSWVNEELGNE